MVITDTYSVRSDIALLNILLSNVTYGVYPHRVQTGPRKIILFQYLNRKLEQCLCQQKSGTSQVLLPSLLPVTNACCWRVATQVWHLGIDNVH